MKLLKDHLTDLPRAHSGVTLVVAAGFEDRAPRAIEILVEHSWKPSSILIIRYPGEEHDVSYSQIKAAISRLSLAEDSLYECFSNELDKILSFIQKFSAFGNQFICDITGFSRKLMFFILGIVYRSKSPLSILYTEAELYYPQRDAFGNIFDKNDVASAFFDLAKYENTDVMYSSKCVVEEIPGYGGMYRPGEPLLLIAFLTFKRSRLGAILREYETNAKILIKGVPVRDDLKWRERAMDAINFDLMMDNSHSVHTVETLDWNVTYSFLRGIYETNNNRYRYNFFIAPLGSKMQTLGAWYFAVLNPQVKFVTSTPTRHFPNKYSSGWKDTFLVDKFVNEDSGFECRS